MVQLWPKLKLTTFTRVVLLIAIYFIGGLLGKEASFLSGSVVLVWPPAGIALAAILLFGYRFWPGVALGAVLFSCMDGTPLGFFTLGTAIGNTIGAIICTYLLRRIGAFNNSMERIHDVTSYIALVCFLGTTVNATFNVVGLIYGGGAKWDDMFSNILGWWVPNALAALVVAPLIITWASPSATRWTRRLIVEAIVCAVGLVAGTVLSFNSWIIQGIQNYPLAYLPYPFLIWSALRFGPRGATAGTFLVSALAMYSLLQGTGPFVTNSVRDSLMLIGSYIGVLAITNLLLAASAAERRKAERAVSESEKRFRAVVEDQTDMICRFKPDGLLTFVNEAFCRFHGKSADELIGKNFFTQTLSEEDAAVPLSYVNTLPKEQPVVSFDHRLRSPEGIVVWHQYRIRRLFSEKGETFEFQAVIQDITKRKQSEEALRASEEKYRSLIDHIPDVIWTADPSGKIIYLGGNADKVLGFSSGELLGQRLWMERIHSEDAEPVEEAYKALFTRNQKFDMEYRFRRKDGQWIWLHNRAVSTRRHKGDMCADGIFLDITNRRQSEVALQRAKEAAEAANLAKSRFLASMSHELRTPLNSIIGFSEVLTDKLFGDLNDRQLKYTNNIINSGRHLLQLINDILDLAKVESGRAELLCSTFDVVQVLQDALALVKTMASRKAVELCSDLPHDLPLLFADEAKFKQILYNLLSNAIKFTPDNGKVCVAAAVTAESLRVSVADTGIGIKPQDHARVFQEFEQVDSSYGRQQQGTGLGLALTKRLVELHGGRIELESEGIEGRGSIFSFTIPLRKDDTRPASTSEELVESKDQALRPLILILANKSYPSSISDHLAGVGYDVSVAAGRAALAEVLKSRRPFAVVIYIEQLAPKEIRELQTYRSQIAKEIPLVAISINEHGRPEFRLFNPAGAVEERANARLIDAIRRSGKTSGKELQTVLIIEDEPALLELLTITLLEKGFKVLRASDGRSGVDCAKSVGPDVVILDLNLPDLSGAQVVEQLRKNSKTRSTPILVHTGIALDEHERDELAAHVQSITSKAEQNILLAELERIETSDDNTKEIEAAL